MAAPTPWFRHPAILRSNSDEIRTRLGISPNHASFRAGVLRTHLLTALFAHSAAQHLGSQARVVVRWDDSDSRRSHDEHRQNLLDELTRIAQIPIDDEKNAFRQSRRGDRYREALGHLAALGFLVTERGLPCLDVSAVDRSMKAEGIPPDSLTMYASVNTSVPRTPSQGVVPLMRSDGRALWHLATVVDDIDNRTDLIVRGTDKRDATAVQVRLYWALSGGRTPPAHLFLPKLLEPGPGMPRVTDLMRRGVRPSTLRYFLAQPYLTGSKQTSAYTDFRSLVGRTRTVLPRLSDSHLDEEHLRALERKMSAVIQPEIARQELRDLHPDGPERVIGWLSHHYPRPLLQQSRLCRALTDTAIDYEDPPEQAEEALRWLETWAQGNTKGPAPHPVRWILTGQRSGPRASQLLEVLPTHLLAVRLGAARQALSRSSAARRRSRVRSLPSSSSDSKRGRPTVRPVTATRTGA